MIEATTWMQRARGTIEQHLPETARPAADPAERELLNRYVAAFEHADMDGLVALLREDATLRMPPQPSLRGGLQIARFFLDTIAQGDLTRIRHRPTWANRRPAVTIEVRGDDGTWIPHGISVLEIEEGQIVGIAAFLDPALPQRFGVPAAGAGLQDPSPIDPSQGGGTLMPNHRIGTQEEWQAERDELLREEKELTRRSDEQTKKRRELPWVPVEKDYRFETPDGRKTLAELFDGRSQLVVYHFMFGPQYDAGCPVCSSIADTLAPQVPHLKARDTTLLLASRAPLEKLIAYRQRMGWDIDWASSGSSDFNRDLGFMHTEEELRPFLEGEIPATVEQNARMCGTDAKGYVTEGPGLSAYALSEGTVYRTYVTTARGLEPAMAYYGLLDRTPKGRDEDPSEPLWVRRHDEY